MEIRLFSSGRSSKPCLICSELRREEAYAAWAWSTAAFRPRPPIEKKTLALPIEMDSVGLAIMRQIMQERHVQAVIVSGVETRL